MKKNFLILVIFTWFVTNVQSQVKEVKSIGITVRDMDRSLDFYTNVLGFEKIDDDELAGSEAERLQGLFAVRIRIVKLRLGNEIVELSDYLTAGGRSIPENHKSNDLSFQHIAIVVSDMEKAYQKLRHANVEHVSSSPQTIPLSNKAAGGIRAFYFRDPDGHTLELIWFPKGKGAAKWQHQNKLFLGIDHTAIAVSSTQESINFYSKLLGLEIKGESHNHGIEQSHLNAVEMSTVHITGLRSIAGPGIEFLEYLEPGPGKKYPSDSRTDDLWHWQTELIVENIDKLFESCKKNGYELISKGIVSATTRNGTIVKSFIVRDPDGHAMLLRENIN